MPARRERGGSATQKQVVGHASSRGPDKKRRRFAASPTNSPLKGTTLRAGGSALPAGRHCLTPHSVRPLRQVAVPLNPHTLRKPVTPGKTMNYLFG